MNVGKAITDAMKQQRRSDITWLAFWCLRHEGYRTAAYHKLLAYWMWGWDINGRGGLGKPGVEA